MADELLQRQLAEIFAADQQAAASMPDGSRSAPESVAAGGDESLEPDVVLPREVTLVRIQDAMIESFLDRRRLWHRRDEDGAILVRFDGEDERLGAFFYWFKLTGPDKDILELRVSFEAQFDPIRYGDILRVCNEWNMTYRMPKACFFSDDESGTLVLLVSHFCWSGTTEEQVHDLLDLFLATSGDFHDWALAEEQRLF